MAHSVSTERVDHDAGETVRAHHGKQKPRVLFLCDGQEGHALVAQSILAHKADSHFVGYSAHTGTDSDVQPACQLLHQYNIRCTDERFQPVDAYKEEHMDFLIALSPGSVQSGKPLPSYKKFIPWDITEGGSTDDKQRVIKYINDQINYFLSVYLYR
ncbi:hypothetical protein [Enterovibrio paralichthyis]|uniref:hypothetical protein n=1 Tax=Enterovibrio paralichthyis TaxID=2853805 RepID=UPI001C44EB97|nr:hypothetical protein [Enterovibrio paralichthyis]MBV7299473.1 hypothetical protein [Enterovibrio paralichthyis]